jgi:hypothetical protein
LFLLMAQLAVCQRGRISRHRTLDRTLSKMQIHVLWALSRRSPVSERSLQQAANGYAELASVNCRGMGAQACRHCQHTTKGTEVSMGFQVSEPRKNDRWSPRLAQTRPGHNQPATGSGIAVMPSLWALTNLKGLTTSQVATMLEASYHGAGKLLITLERVGMPPITRLDGRRVMLQHHLRSACRSRNRRFRYKP